MRALEQEELLRVWESAEGADDAAVLLLEAAGAGSPAKLPVGARDAFLIELRDRLFGSVADALAQCPYCAEPVEVSLDLNSIMCDVAPVQAEYVLEHDGLEIRFRLPESDDLREAGRASSVPEARQTILRRCVLGVTRGGDPADSRTLDESATTAIAACMENADHGGRTDLVLTCPACSRRFEVPFDIAQFFWTEIDGSARRILRDIHTLASAYGWSEAEILALSPRRRQMYLEMIHA
jgi:hypothetical protein